VAILDVMSARALQLGRAQPAPRFSVPVGVLAAVVLGAVAAWQPVVALALLAVLALGSAIALRSAGMLMVMVASVFVEAVQIAGTDVSRLVAPVALVALVVALLSGKAAVRPGSPLLWAFAYSVWALASGLWSVNVGATVSQLISLAIALVYMLSFAAWLSDALELKWILGWLAIASLAVGLYAIETFVSAGSTGLQTRSAGGAGDPNFFAAYQIFAIPLILVLAGEVERRWLRSGLYLLVLVVIGSVLTTLSRGGLIALGAITVLTLGLPARALFRSQRQKRRVLLGVLVALGVGFLAVAGTFAPRLNSFFSEGGGSGRLILWEGAITAIKEHPLGGLGYGGYQSASDDLVYRTPGVSLEAYDLPPKGQVAHSAYLGTAAELGIPGLLLFLGLIVSTGASLRRVARSARRVRADFVGRVATALLVSLVGWVLASIFLSSETSRPLWIIIGIALALPKLVERAAARAAARPARASPR
jgi:O-antigen ligase